MTASRRSPVLHGAVASLLAMAATLPALASDHAPGASPSTESTSGSGNGSASAAVTAAYRASVTPAIA